MAAVSGASFAGLYRLGGSSTVGTGIGGCVPAATGYGDGARRCGDVGPCSASGGTRLIRQTALGQ